MHIHKLVHDNLSFSDICHNDARSPTASEVCFTLGSVQFIEETNTVWTLRYSGVWKRQLQLSDVQYFLLWGLIPSWELHMNNNSTSVNNCFFHKKKRKDRISLRGAVVLNRKILLQKMQPNSRDQNNAFTFSTSCTFISHCDYIELFIFLKAVSLLQRPPITHF